MSTPYIGFGNDTLSRLPVVREGDLIACANCSGEHPLEYGTSDGKKTDTLGFYCCGEKSFLGSVAGKLVVARKPDVSGTLTGEDKDG